MNAGKIPRRPTLAAVVPTMDQWLQIFGYSAEKCRARKEDASKQLDQLTRARELYRKGLHEIQEMDVSYEMKHGARIKLQTMYNIRSTKSYA